MLKQLTSHSQWSQWGKDFANKLNLTKQYTILDMGCRNGAISAYLAKNYPQQKFLAIDNLANEIESAKDFRLSNLSFETVDALQLSYTDYFDAVVSFNCLLWIKDKGKVLRNIYQ